jgi:hypothetical protein
MTSPYWNAAVSDPYIIEGRNGDRRRAIKIKWLKSMMTPEQLEEVGGRGDKSTTYCRYVMERHIGRLLRRDETVEHMDGDTMNDDISNLKIVPRTSAQKKWDAQLPLGPKQLQKDKAKEQKGDADRTKASYPEYYGVTA